MIVYFEDGELLHAQSLPTRDIIDVDARFGYSNCRRRLRRIKDNYPFDTAVYTNSLDAFSNLWCWSEEKKTPMIYIRNENGDWTLIQELTTRELRMAHNLEKLFVNGAFVNVAT